MIVIKFPIVESVVARPAVAKSDVATSTVAKSAAAKSTVAKSAAAKSTVAKLIFANSTLWPGVALTLLSLVSLTLVSRSQQFAQVQPQPALSQPPQTQAPEAQQAVPPPAVTWERIPHMQLEAEYAGPLKDTAIQRWRDPSSDVVCYLYIPFTAQHSPPMANGYVQYGANSIGNISCLPSRPVAAAAPPKPVSPNPVARPGPPRLVPIRRSA